jgi:exopolysaccharide production protein ExoZ
VVELSQDIGEGAGRPRPGAELVSIQYLRGLACLFVVGWHAMGEVGTATWKFCNGGIEIFFLISGFVIWTITAAKPTAPGTFLARRFARVIPFYWAVTTVALLILLIAPQLVQTMRFSLPHVIASYLFLPWPSPAPGVDTRPLVIPGWTLNYEMFFYVLAALALCLPKRWRGVGLVTALIALPLAGRWIGGTSIAAAFYTSPLLVEMGVGVFLAIVTARRDAPPWLALSLLTGGAGLLIAGGELWDGTNTQRLVTLCIPAAMILVGAVGLDRAGRMPTWRVPKAIGDASYAIYMIHPLMLSAMVQVWRRLGGAAAPGWSFVMLSLVACSVVGLAVHLAVEKPMTEALQRRLKLGRHKSRPVAVHTPSLKALG